MQIHGLLALLLVPCQRVQLVQPAPLTTHVQRCCWSPASVYSPIAGSTMRNTTHASPIPMAPPYAILLALNPKVWAGGRKCGGGEEYGHVGLPTATP